MKIGILKDIKKGEYRVIATPCEVATLIEDGNEVIVAHGNGPQVGIINNAMLALMHEDPTQGATPLSVCGAMSQAYIGYDLQNFVHVFFILS